MLKSSDLDRLAAIGRLGSIRAAAAELGAHPATLYRWLAALERSVGGPLFYRDGGRLRPTELGEEVISVAEAARIRLTELNRRLAGAAQDLSGKICATTTDSLAPVVCRALAVFGAAYPQVQVELQLSNAPADLGRHEADVAIRPTRHPPETLVGRRVAHFEYGVYAADAAPPPGWIVLDRSLGSIPSSRWLSQHIDDDPVTLVVNSMWAAGEACAAGLGRALLPSYVARRLGLKLITGPVEGLESAVWMLTHEDLRRSPRVRSFVAEVGATIRREVEPRRFEAAAD